MRKPVRTTQNLSYTVNLWSEDERSICEVLAKASSLSIARAAFEAAIAHFPDRMLTLLGPGALDVQAPTNAAWGCERVQVH